MHNARCLWCVLRHFWLEYVAFRITNRRSVWTFAWGGLTHTAPKDSTPSPAPPAQLATRHARPRAALRGPADLVIVNAVASSLSLVALK